MYQIVHVNSDGSAGPVLRETQYPTLLKAVNALSRYQQKVGGEVDAGIWEVSSGGFVDPRMVDIMVAEEQNGNN